MKLKRARIVSLILAVFMLLTMAACTDKNTSDNSTTSQAETKAPDQATEAPQEEEGLINKTGYPIAKEPLTINAKVQRATDTADWNDLWCFEKILEITNIDFEFDCINSESWEEKMNLLFASQNLPDMFFVRSGYIKEVEVANYGSQGLIIPLEGYLDEWAPLLSEYFEQYPDVKKSQMSPDGHVYELYTFIENERERSTRRYWLNTAWIDNLGLEVPTNTDEFYDVMMAFKNEDANGNGDPTDEIPIPGIYNTYQAMDIPLLVAFGFVDTRLDTVSDSVVYVPTEENYKHYLEYFNKLYKSDLVDPDYFSQTSDQFLAKGAEGTYGNIAYYAEWLIMTDEEGYSQYDSPEPLVSEYNDTQMWPAKTTVLSGGVAVTNVCEYPEAIVRLMDWFCTLEGTLIAQYGPENGTWEGGEGGWTLVTKDGVTGYEVAWPEKYANYNEFRKQELNPMALPIMSKPEGVPVGQYYTGLNPKQVKLTNDIVENFAPYYKVAFPMAKMTTEEAQEINSIETDLEPYVQQMEARFMIGEESFENYDAFIQGCKDRGSDRLVEIYQQIYNRFNSN